jgi:hypothetical protein
MTMNIYTFDARSGALRAVSVKIVDCCVDWVRYRHRFERYSLHSGKQFYNDLLLTSH